MVPEDKIRLRHMRDAAALVGKFVAGRSQADLGSDLQLQFAVVRAVEIIGEAASKVSGETRTSLPDIRGQGSSALATG